MITGFGIICGTKKIFLIILTWHTGTSYWIILILHWVPFPCLPWNGKISSRFCLGFRPPMCEGSPVRLSAVPCRLPGTEIIFPVTLPWKSPQKWTGWRGQKSSVLCPHLQPGNRLQKYIPLRSWAVSRMYAGRKNHPFICLCCWQPQPVSGFRNSGPWSMITSTF